MSCDLSVDSFDEDDFGIYRDSPISHRAKEENFHTMIHSAMVPTCHRFQATVLSGSVQHIAQAYRSSILRVNSRPSKDGPDDDSAVKVEGGFKYEWGGANGSTFSAYGRGVYQDNNGNYAKAEIEYKDQDKGHVSASGGREMNFGTPRSK